MENICDPPFTIHHNFAVIVHSNWICPPKTRGRIWNPELLLQKPPIVWPCRMMTWHDLCATILASMRPQSYYDVKCNGREVFNIQITRMLRLQHRVHRGRNSRLTGLGHQTRSPSGTRIPEIRVGVGKAATIQWSVWKDFPNGTEKPVSVRSEANHPDA